MERHSGYFKGLLQILRSALEMSIKVMGILGIVVGSVVLYEMYFTPNGRTTPMTLEATIFTYGALALVLGFVLSFIYYTIMYFVRRSKATPSNNAVSIESKLNELKVNITLNYTTANPKYSAKVLANLSKFIMENIEDAKGTGTKKTKKTRKGSKEY